MAWLVRHVYGLTSVIPVPPFQCSDEAKHLPPPRGQWAHTKSQTDSRCPPPGPTSRLCAVLHAGHGTARDRTDGRARGGGLPRVSQAVRGWGAGFRRGVRAPAHIAKVWKSVNEFLTLTITLKRCSRQVGILSLPMRGSI